MIADPVVKFEKVGEEAKLPTKRSAEAAGVDLFASEAKRLLPSRQHHSNDTQK